MNLPIFPSEEYLALCEKYKKELKKEWEKRVPRMGDWVIPVDTGVPGLVSHLVDDISCRVRWRYTKAMMTELVEDLIWLPSQRQLQQMLEERGRFVMFNGPYAMEERRYQITAMAEDLDRLDARIDAYGPDPETALLQAWLASEKVRNPVGTGQ